jgi:hypothetical protein
MVRPSALAVVMSMANSNLVGCSTGRSAREQTLQNIQRIENRLRMLRRPCDGKLLGIRPKDEFTTRNRGGVAKASHMVIRTRQTAVKLKLDGENRNLVCGCPRSLP